MKEMKERRRKQQLLLYRQHKMALFLCPLPPPCRGPPLPLIPLLPPLHHYLPHQLQPPHPPAALPTSSIFALSFFFSLIHSESPFIHPLFHSLPLAYQHNN